MKIRNHTTGETAALVRDVCHHHPNWVHAQIGTDTESELQNVLDGLIDSEYAAHPYQCDECGIYAEKGDRK
ncbi:MAG: hypothetical protein FJ189_03425 [Gammaproteobacteria bacterium]|nr:hypothetical protein [Gammaproteobacteria bacterium]